MHLECDDASLRKLKDCDYFITVLLLVSNALNLLVASFNRVKSDINYLLTPRPANA
jgi:hypothetical protein